MTRLGFAFIEDPMKEFTRKPEGDSGPYRHLASEMIRQCHDTIDIITRMIDQNPRGVTYQYAINGIDLVGRGTRMLLARIDQEIAWLTRRNGFAFWSLILRCENDELEDIHELLLERARAVRERLSEIVRGGAA